MPRVEIRRILLYGNSMPLGLIDESLRDPRSGTGGAGGGADGDVKDGSGKAAGPRDSGGEDMKTHHDVTGGQAWGVWAVLQTPEVPRWQALCLMTSRPRTRMMTMRIMRVPVRSVWNSFGR